MTTTEMFETTPMAVGAEIRKVDLSRLDDPALAAALYAEWMKYGVLLFRDTPLDNQQHLALSRCFGELEMHPLPEIRSKEEPLFMELGGKNPDKAHVYDGRLLVGRVAWHRDTAYTVDICKGAMLRILEIPEEGGNTSFCDTAAAYDALTPDMKAKIDGLEFKATLRLDQMLMARGVTWKNIRVATEEECPGSRRAVPLDALNRFAAVVHPLVVAHPESGRKCLFFSPTYLDEMIGLPKEEGDALLDFLVDHALSPQFCYTHHWRPNDVVLWDNRRMMHATEGYPPALRRRILRTTLAGSMNTGHLYDPSETVRQATLVD